MPLIVVAVGAYLIGSVPLAYIIVRLATGRDLRTAGSGNVGVMNTARQAGIAAGVLAFLGEGVKGVAALGVARGVEGTPLAYTVAGLAVLIGTNWPLFLRFHGGRGTTVTAFIAAILLWQLVLLVLVAWLAVYRLTRDNFIATRTMILTMPLMTAGLVWLTGASWMYVAYATAGSAIVLSRHRRETDDHYQLRHRAPPVLANPPDAAPSSGATGAPEAPHAPGA